jgi:DNA-binding GntR family transcriptional regulator
MTGASARARRAPDGRPVKPVQAIAGTSLADELAFRLAESILDGDYRPGDRIMQDEICTQFGVSRTPVREALRKLQAQNLVVVTPNRGATIRIPTQDELVEGWAIRAELEGFATELACTNLDDELLRELDRAQAAIESGADQLGSVESDDIYATAYTAVKNGNEDFHAAILRAAHNEQLRVLCESLQSYLPKDYYWRAVRSSHAERVLNVDEHRPIREALGRRDAKAARDAMRTHLLHGRDILIVYLTEQGFWD